MADNPQVNTNTLAVGATNVTVAGDDIGGVVHQLVKVEFGAADSATQVSAANPLPVVQTGTPDLPTGAATETTSAAILAKIIASPATESTLASVLSELGQKTEPSDVQLTAFDPVQAYSFYPGFTPPPPAGTLRGPSFDEYGAVYQRGGVTTDEGSVRVGYSGAALARALGSCTFTNGSDQVTGTAFTTLDPQPLVGDYIKLTADTEASYRRIYSIDSDTAITLDGNYTGTGGTGATDLASMKPVTTGTGATVTVASGQATIACNTTAAQTIALTREVDYGPLVYQSRFAISQRIANQTIYRGFVQPSLARRYVAAFRFDSTVNTTVICDTGWALTAPASGTDLQSTTFTLPNGLTTATAQEYRIELRGEVVSFYVAGINVATHTIVLPRPYDVVSMGTLVLNGTTPASNTNVVIDYELCNNIDSLRISVANLTDNMLANQPPAMLFAYNVAGVIVINTDLIVIDCSQIRALSIQCAAMGTTGVVTGQWCNEPTFAVPTTASLYDQTGTVSTTFNAAGLRVVNVCARYFRLRLTTATTAGTTTINVQGFQFALTPPITTQAVSGTVTANIGTGSLAAGTNIIGAIRLAADSTQGAGTTHHLISAATTNATSVKASAGTINTMSCSNANAAARYFKLYNKASAPTVGTDTPVATILLKPGETTIIDCGSYGRRLATGIAYAITTGMAVADTGAVAVTEHAVEMSYT